MCNELIKYIINLMIYCHQKIAFTVLGTENKLF